MFKQLIFFNFLFNNISSFIKKQFFKYKSNKSFFQQIHKRNSNLIQHFSFSSENKTIIQINFLLNGLFNSFLHFKPKSISQIIQIELNKKKPFLLLRFSFHSQTFFHILFSNNISTFFIFFSSTIFFSCFNISSLLE